MAAARAAAKLQSPRRAPHGAADRTARRRRSPGASRIDPRRPRQLGRATMAHVHAHAGSSPSADRLVVERPRAAAPATSSSVTSVVSCESRATACARQREEARWSRSSAASPRRPPPPRATQPRQPRSAAATLRRRRHLHLERVRRRGVSMKRLRVTARPHERALHLDALEKALGGVRPLTRRDGGRAIAHAAAQVERLERRAAKAVFSNSFSQSQPSSSVCANIAVANEARRRATSRRDDRRRLDRRRRADDEGGSEPSASARRPPKASKASSAASETRSDVSGRAQSAAARDRSTPKRRPFWQIVVPSSRTRSRHRRPAAASS